MSHPRVLVFPDSGSRIGGGHVMRCLTLARALTAKGAACAFAASPATQAILTPFGAPDIAVLPIEGAPEEAARAAGAFGADWVLLDHYAVTPQQETGLRWGRRLAALDDLGDRPRAADLLMNPGYGYTHEHYRDLAPGAVILTGPGYAPVRPEFARRRDAALAHRREGGHLRHALIALGLTDVGGITERVVGLARPLLGEMILDVVMGAAAPSLVGLREAAKRDPHLRLHIDTPAMAELMATADIAVGAGGSSCWERAVLGLPTATVILADNQRPMARAMAADGLTLTADVTAADFEADLALALSRLLADAALRRSMTEKTAALCDGLGAERFADALLGLASPEP